MSRRSFFSRLDDWMNPIVVKELRQAVQSKLVVGALLLFLLLQILFLGGFLLSQEIKSDSGSISLRAGRSLFQTLQYIMLGTCMLVPAYVGARLGGERSDTNVDLLFITTMKPRSIITGKFLSGLVLILLIFSACTPFMTFTYLLRGMDMPSILLIVAGDLLLALLGLSWTIFLAVIPAPRLVRGALGLLGFITLIYLFLGGVNLTFLILELGVSLSLTSWELWLPVLMLFAQMGLLLTWAVAILSPPSANKAPRLRLYVLAVIVLSGVATYLASNHLGDYAPLTVWMTLVASLVPLQLFISVNEREHLGLRVTRAIPRARLPRLGAFLLYSGSAGGVLFSVLLLLACIGATLLVIQNKGGDMLWLSSMMRGGAPRSLAPGEWMHLEAIVAATRLLVLIGLYTYCFCLTAVILRIVVFRHHIRPGFTWLLALLLVGLGSVGPYMLAFLTRSEQIRYGRLDSSWLLTNPFASIGEAMGLDFLESPNIFDSFCMPFLLTWAGIVTAVNIPWFVGQLARFRPPAKAQARKVPLAA